VRDFKADLEAFMNALHIDTAVIVGASSGGFVARRLAIDDPARVLGLVLWGSPATLQNKPKVLEWWRSTVSRLDDPIDPEFVREFQAGTLVQQVPPAFFETIVREALEVPAYVWRETLAGMLEDDTLAELSKIKAPTLVVWGEQDPTLPYSDQKVLADSIPGARLLTYAGAGHTFYWEEPARAASDLVAFIQHLDLLM
jgi:pimeloyl-ACP methyl ester carboxylesterase